MRAACSTSFADNVNRRFARYTGTNPRQILQALEGNGDWASDIPIVTSLWKPLWTLNIFFTLCCIIIMIYLKPSENQSVGLNLFQSLDFIFHFHLSGSGVELRQPFTLSWMLHLQLETLQILQLSAKIINQLQSKAEIRGNHQQL